MSSPERLCSTIAVVAPDLNGKLRTRLVPIEHFDPDDTPCLVDIIFAFDASDQLIPRPDGFTGWWPSWDDGFGDLSTRPDLTTRRRIGWRDGVDVVFADLRHADATDVAVAPRRVLNTVADDLSRTGYTARIGAELEFFLTDPAQSGPHEQLTCDAYSFAPPLRDQLALAEIVDCLRVSDIGVASWYSEGGPRQYEIALAHTDPVTAADSALLARYAIEEVSSRHGLLASFRPKPGPGFGSGLHVHVSVCGALGTNLLQQLGDGDPGSTGARALAGLLAVLQPATAIFSPTPEGFLRLTPHTAAGTSATWARDNRSAGIRYLDRASQSRLEMRCAASDANPYLVIAAALAGIQHGITTDTLVRPLERAGDIYEQASVDTALPADLRTAAGALVDDPVLNRSLGSSFVAHYAATRRWAADIADSG